MPNTPFQDAQLPRTRAAACSNLRLRAYPTCVFPALDLAQCPFRTSRARRGAEPQFQAQRAPDGLCRFIAVTPSIKPDPPDDATRRDAMRAWFERRFAARRRSVRQWLLRHGVGQRSAYKSPFRAKLRAARPMVWIRLRSRAKSPLSASKIATSDTSGYPGLRAAG